MTTEHPAWPADIHAVLRSGGVRQVGLVPDSGHARLIQLVDDDPDMVAVKLTTEEEGVALLAGAWLGGDRGVLLMQSSGAGNCVNMLSLPLETRLPLLMLITMRGDEGEFNGMQIPMGNACAKVLEAIGVIVRRADRVEDIVPAVTSGMKMAFNAYRPVAVLISQEIIGAKDFRALTRMADVA